MGWWIWILLGAGLTVATGGVLTVLPALLHFVRKGPYDRISHL